MIDLHSHTNKSDGSLSPGELIALARRKGLQTLAITDHDTLEGYDEAVPDAREAGLDLICGVELSTKFRGQTVHILGYFFDPSSNQEFRGHLDCLQKARKDRNHRLAARLRELGLSIDVGEVERLGRSQAGRPHFARLLVEKGYVSKVQEAFDRYLDESAPGYVERKEASLDNVINWIHQGGGLASWAHPVRMVKKSGVPVETLFREMHANGIDAIEAYHSDHGPHDRDEYLAAAAKLGLAVTGGSDFHGDSKPHIDLGGVSLPADALEALRSIGRAPASRP
jgi:predicted metal-dependent phosphoesterase TrpH